MKTDLEIVEELLIEIKRPERADDLINFQKIECCDLIGMHHTLGQYIRNKYQLWANQIDSRHPDDRSIHIICLFWQYLNPEKPLTGYSRNKLEQEDYQYAVAPFNKGPDGKPIWIKT